MTTRIAIDLNVRVRGNDTYAGFEDVTGPLSVGDPVEVFEPESGLVGSGRVTEIDPDRELVYLSVDWSSLKVAAPSDHPAESAVTVAPSIPLLRAVRTGSVTQGWPTTSPVRYGHPSAPHTEAEVFTLRDESGDVVTDGGLAVTYG